MNEENEEENMEEEEEGEEEEGEEEEGEEEEGEEKADVVYVLGVEVPSPTCVICASSSRRCFSIMAASNDACILSRPACTTAILSSASFFSFMQGLTLVHFSAQPEPFLTQSHALDTP